MAFISGRVNRNISNKEPIDYFPIIIRDRGEEALLSQEIPNDSSLWRIDNYKEFLLQRRTSLSDAINRFIEQSAKQGRAVDIR
ncbi:MAG: hypothetical protein AB1306_03530 [Nitrospirota bacterium]